MLQRCGYYIIWLFIQLFKKNFIKIPLEIKWSMVDLLYKLSINIKMDRVSIHGGFLVMTYVRMLTEEKYDIADDMLKKIQYIIAVHGYHDEKNEKFPTVW